MSKLLLGREVAMAIVLLVLSIVVQSVHAQPFSILANATDPYGISIWGGAAWQVERNNPVGVYGANIKIGQAEFMRTSDTLQQMVYDTVCKCATSQKINVTLDSNVVTFRVSLGAGYLEYVGLQARPSALVRTSEPFSVNGPYIGVYAGIPLPFLGTYRRGGRDRAEVSISAGYTNAIVSADKITTYYTGPDITGFEKASIPLQMTIPTTFAHELSVGFSWRRNFFLVAYYNYFKVRNAQFSHFDDRFKVIPEIAHNAGPKLDLSMRGVKAGFSVDF